MTGEMAASSGHCGNGEDTAEGNVGGVDAVAEKLALA